MKFMRSAILLLGAMMAAPGMAADVTPSGAFTLWQLPNQTHTQMMSYVIKTAGGKIIVIDGGMAGDAPYLRDFLTGLGGNVDMWFITHAHDDHFTALSVILREPGALRIGAIYGSLPDAAWIDQWGDTSEKACFKLFTSAVAAAGRTVEELSLGQTLALDGITIEVLGVKNPEITRNAINNSSMVLRMADATKSVLFLADLGVEGGEKLLKSAYAQKLPSDYVQMAHHGQAGVSEVFYQQVKPSYCLWPAPRWLYDNDNGGGKGSGRWRTLEVRAWMDKMPIKRHYAMCEGLHQIE